MGNLEQAVQGMINMCNNNQHGYDQAYRWGPNYDCSSAIITALKNAGFDVGGSTYTGNMSANLCARGWSRLTPGIAKQRGDILLNDVNHVAMYVGNNQLAEFSINEKGQIVGGQSGDQTGREAWVHNYYNYPWNCVLRYVGANNAPSNLTSNIDVYYAVRLIDGTVLPEVKNLEDYAGEQGKLISGIAIRVSQGTIRYRVHTLKSGWLPHVTGYSWNDFYNGWAGDGESPIDMVEVYLNSPNGDLYIYYRVSPLNQDYYAYQIDDIKAPGLDGYAGDPKVYIDRIQMYIATY